MKWDQVNNDTRLSSVGGEPHAVLQGDDGRPRDAGAATSHHAASGPGHFLTDAEREAIEWGAAKSDAESHIADAAAGRGYIPEGGGDPRQWARNHAARAATLRRLLERIR